MNLLQHAARPCEHLLLDAPRSCSLPVASTCLSLHGQPSPSTLPLCPLAQPPSMVVLPDQGLSQHSLAPTGTRAAPRPAAFCHREAQERREPGHGSLSPAEGKQDSPDHSEHQGSDGHSECWDLWDGRPGEGLLVAQQLRQECGGDAEEPAACGALEAGRGAQGRVEGIRGFGVLEGGVPSQQSGTQEPRVVRAMLYRGSGVGGWAVLTGVCTISHDQQAQGAEADVPLTSLSQERPMHVAGLHQCSLGCRGAGCA